MKKILLFILIFTFFTSTINAQIYIRPSLSTTYMHGSKMVGWSITNDVVLPLKKNNLIIGGGFAHSEGNRNFDRNVPGNYTIEYENRIATLDPLGALSYQYYLPKEFKVKTSTTFQYIIKIGYEFVLEKGKLETGLYGTYVNKNYIADIIEDARVTRFPYFSEAQAQNADIIIPFNLRYIDLGPYIGYSYPVFKKLKNPMFIKSLLYVGFYDNSRIDIGVSIGLIGT